MNLDRRYRCSTHPHITVGATEGETHPPLCQFCRQPMVVISAPAPTSEQPPRRVDDPRTQRPPRPEGRPL